MRTITIRQSREIDLKAASKYGMPVLLLMENAGRSVAEETLTQIQHKDKDVVVICGKGNNGGDGFVAARHLLAEGIGVKVFLAGKISDVRNEAKINLEILLKLKRKIIEVDAKALPLIKKQLLKSAVIIDALLGVGVSGEVRGVYGDLIRLINASEAYVVSVDIPSGLDADTGKILGCCVKAQKTVTFLAKKRGMVSGAAPKYCGHIVVKGLGIPIC
jgi:NAD(P)H-hydrate epimerase